MPHTFRTSNHRHTPSSPAPYGTQPSSEHSPGFSPFPNLNPPTFTASQSRNMHTGHEHRHESDQHAGAEPGVNPRSGASIAEYSHFKQDCCIDIVDYDSEDVTFQRFTNAGFVDFMKKVGARQENDLPPRMVRWINIGGIDWGVLSAIALRYNLHSLALEDILHERGHTHSKADYYPGHLFIRVLCHSLGGMYNDSSSDSIPNESSMYYNEDNQASLDPMSGLPLYQNLRMPNAEEGGARRSLSQSNTAVLSDTDSISKILKNVSEPDPQQVPGKGINAGFLPFSLVKRLTGLSGFGGRSRLEKNKKIKALTEGDRVYINHDPMFIFLLRDGTVISIHPIPNLRTTSPIAERLNRSDSVLRSSEDASLLVESLLDLVVDRVLEVVDEYQVKIDKLEHDILLNPVMRSVRSLHILSGDLILHKRTLEPIRTMVYGLRRYDLERSRALADTMALEMSHSDADSVHDDDDRGKQKTTGNNESSGVISQARKRRRRRKDLFASEHFPQGHLSDTLHANGQEGVAHEFRHWDMSRPFLDHMQKLHASLGGHKIEGYFSYKSKVYLADVSDHMDFALTSLDMFAGISENLINYAFNVASYEMNIVMNRLTLATIIFLPLTLLTGYFGMNFTPFWSVDHNSDVFFWKIAIPVMAVLVPIFMYNDIRKAVLFTKGRRDSMRVGGAGR